jgi:hypothetical protein
VALINSVNDDIFSTVDLTALLDPTPTQHYGPYASGSTDSGTCGAWATDIFDRHFTVFASTTPGAFTVVEQFKNGTFDTSPPATTAEPSPGGCDTNFGGTVNANVLGSLHGYFIISNVMNRTSTSPFCDAGLMTNTGCTTTKFINTHFTPCYPASCTVPTFFFDYSAGDQSLLFHDWKNASADRGGNRGDIANT